MCLYPRTEHIISADSITWLGDIDIPAWESKRNLNRIRSPSLWGGGFIQFIPHLDWTGSEIRRLHGNFLKMGGIARTILSTRGILAVIPRQDSCKKCESDHVREMRIQPWPAGARFWEVQKLMMGSVPGPGKNGPIRIFDVADNTKNEVRSFTNKAKQQGALVSVLMTPSEVKDGELMNPFCAQSFWLDSVKCGDFLIGRWNVYANAPGRLYLNNTTFYRPSGTPGEQHIRIGGAPGANPRGYKITYPVEFSFGMWEVRPRWEKVGNLERSVETVS